MIAPWWHDLFVALGVAAAAAVFWVEARRRGRDKDDRVWLVVAGALVGGAVMMRLGTWWQHVDLRANASYAFCPHCHEEHPDRPLAGVERLSGWLAVRDQKVWLERGCRSHGLVRTLYDDLVIAYLAALAGLAVWGLVRLIA